MPPSTSAPNLLDRIPPGTAASGVPLWGKIVLTCIGAATIGGAVFAFHLFSSVSKALTTATLGQSGSMFQQLQQIVSPPEKPLKGEDRGQTNILLLGMGGEGHEGALLTDTMIVMSIRPGDGRVGMFSIPRDLVVDMGPQYGFRKINAANAFGEKAGTPGSGSLFATQTVEKLIGAPIDYFVRVDFNGFSELIDTVGGIDVNVDTAFTDYEYPTLNFGYQTVRFTTGWQHMDGATALKFVRSRHGNNGEGSDFARSRRQQKVLEALREKMFSVSTLLNPAVIANALSTLGKHVQTNFQVWELVKLAKIGKTIDRTTLTHRVLDTTPDGLLAAQTGLDGAYILAPRSGKYSDIEQTFADLFTNQALLGSGVVEIQNGTKIAGLASRVADSLTNLPIAVSRIKNASVRTVTETSIYDLTGGTKPQLLTKLQNQLHATIATSIPLALQPSTQSPSLKDLGASFSNSMSLQSLKESPDYKDIDFVILLGSDQATSALPVKDTNTITTKKSSVGTTNSKKSSNTHSKSNTNASTNRNTNGNTNATTSGNRNTGTTNTSTTAQ